MSFETERIHTFDESRRKASQQESWSKEWHIALTEAQWFCILERQDFHLEECVNYR